MQVALPVMVGADRGDADELFYSPDYGGPFGGKGNSRIYGWRDIAGPVTKAGLAAASPRSVAFDGSNAG